jgi:hypothetical protein
MIDGQSQDQHQAVALSSDLVTFNSPHSLWPESRKSIYQQASPGSFDFAPRTVRYAIDPRGASLGACDFLIFLMFLSGKL